MGKTILVVDDDEIAREGFAAVLKREGYAVMVAEDADEATRYLGGSESPDLILTDLFMPGFDGWAFMKQRRQGRPWTHIPIIIVTALHAANEEWAHSLGASGYLQKPVCIEDLMDMVRRHC